MTNIEDVINEQKKVLESLYKAREEKKTTTDEDMRQDVMTFVSSQMNTIKNQDKLREVVEAEILQKIVLHELDTDELLATYKTLSDEKSKNTDVLMSLFRPSNASPNSLMLPPTREEDKSSLDLTPQQRQSLEKLFKVIEHSNMNKENGGE